MPQTDRGTGRVGGREGKCERKEGKDMSCMPIQMEGNKNIRNSDREVGDNELYYRQRDKMQVDSIQKKI